MTDLPMSQEERDLWLAAKEAVEAERERIARWLLDQRVDMPITELARRIRDGDIR